MAAISDLRTDVKLHTNNCPDITIDRAITRSVRFFCKESQYYEGTIFEDQVAGTSDYTLTFSADTNVVTVKAVELSDDNRIYPLNFNQAMRGDSVSGFIFEPPSTLTILPTPTTNVTDGIEVKVVLMPTESTTVFPESIYRNYKESIVAGALWYLLSMQNEAWSNPQLATQKLSEYQQGIFSAKGQRMVDFMPGPKRIKSRPFSI
jgi:hypothetical protein